MWVNLTGQASFTVTQVKPHRLIGSHRDSATYPDTRPLLLRHVRLAVKAKKHQCGWIAPEAAIAARLVMATFDATQTVAGATHALKRRTILF
jgi:hypothetical protein